MPSTLEDKLAHDYKCPRCRDLGVVRVDRPVSDPEFGKLVPCGCRSDAALERMRALSGLHDAELAVTLEELSPDVGPGTRAMLEACRRFIEKPSGFLTLWGGPGVGKTSCLYAITSALLERGAVYISLHALLAHLRESFNGGRETEDSEARLRRFTGVRVLCLDEVDKVKLSDWGTEQLTALVDARFRAGLLGCAGTVLALNSDPRDQPLWIASRLFDGRNVVVENHDADARPQLHDDFEEDA